MKTIGALALLSYVATGDWLAAFAVVVLGAVWFLTRVAAGPPVIFLALTYQWMQCTIGVFYTPISGRSLLTNTSPGTRPMVLMGLGCVLALAVGIHFGIRLVQRRRTESLIYDDLMKFPTLVGWYFAAFVVTGVLQSVAGDYPLFRQALVATGMARLILFFFAVRRLISPQIQVLPIVALLGFEVAIGLTGYFANFRDPLLLAGIAFLEAFDRRRTSHWVTIAAMGVAATIGGVFWMGVRGDYRMDFEEVESFGQSRSMRFERLQQLGREWTSQDWQEMLWTVDFLIDRQWAVYYPALAVERIPSVLAHTEGELLLTAIEHVAMPRVIFPNKRDLISDSELVRKYSGVWVAGEEEGTSIAFGYAAEAYVDFGPPLMFLPALVWGLFLGWAYQMLRTLVRHEKLLTPLLCVVFWFSLFLFERSWARTMGNTGTFLIYVGGGSLLLDRWMMQGRLIAQRARGTATPSASATPLTEHSTLR